MALEQQNQKTAEAVEVKKDQVAERTITPSEKTKLLEQCEATMKRREQAKERLLEAMNASYTLKDKRKAEELHEEARLLLEGISKKLPEHIVLPDDINQADAILQKSYFESMKVKLEMLPLLKQYGLDVSEEEWSKMSEGVRALVLDEGASNIEKIKIILDTIDELRQVGLSSVDIKKFLSCEALKDPKNPPKTLIAIIGECNKSGMGIDEALSIIQLLSREEKIVNADEMLEAVQEMGQLELTGEDMKKFFTCEVFLAKGISAKNLIEIVKECRKYELSMDDAILFPSLHYTDKEISSGIAKMKAARIMGISNEEIRKWVNQDTKFTTQDIIPLCVKLKEMGATGEDVYKLISNSEYFGNPPSLQKVFEVTGKMMKEGAKTVGEALEKYETIDGMSEKIDMGEGKSGEEDKREMEVRDYYFSQNKTAQIFIKEMVRRTRSTDLGNIKMFMDDGALPQAMVVYEMAFQNEPPAKGVEKALMVGRNLFFDRKSYVITSELIEEKVREIEALHAEIDPIPLFQGRNVIFVAHNQKEDDGVGSFDYPELRKGLEDSVENGTLDFENLGNKEVNDRMVEAFKAKILRKIATTPPPMTFFFNGHGAVDALGLTKMQIVNGKPLKFEARSISVDEIARAMADRAKNFPGREDELRKDIFIFSACYNQNFIRRVYGKNRELGGVQPISLGESDFGQYGFSGDKRIRSFTEKASALAGKIAEVASMSADEIIENITEGLRENKEQALYGVGKKGWKIGDYRKSEGAYEDSNLNVFAPAKEDAVRIIAKNEAAAEDLPA